MEFAEVVRGRRMTRSYDPDRPVPRSEVEMLLNQAIRAPSAGHTQAWGFVILDDITSRELFWSATASGPDDRWLAGMRTAPVLVLCLSDENAYRRRYAEPDKADKADTAGRGRDGHLPWPVPYWHVDVGMAAMILLLAARDAGLGACFFGVPVERVAALQAAFEIPPDREIVGVVSLGYAAPDRRSPSLRRGRRPLAEVVHWGRFGARA